MKSFFGILIGLILISAGCESTSATSSAKKKESTQESTPVKKASLTVTDYSQIDEISDVSGEFIINGNVNNPQKAEGKYITLYETEGKDLFPVDSVLVKGGKFKLSLKKANLGFHKIGLFKHNAGEFILNPEEKEITLIVTPPSINRTLKVTGSKENAAYTAYKAEKRKHDAALQTIRKMKASTEVKLKKIHEQEAEFKIKQDEMADANPNTYFAKIVRRFMSPHRFNKAKYWDDVDFTDESMIRSVVLSDRIQDYMRQHGKGGKEGNDGFLDAVDLIYAKADNAGNDKVKVFMLYTMMEGFYSSKMFEGSNYIMDNYIYDGGCGSGEAADLIKMKADGLRSLEIGKTPPDFSIEDVNGKMVNLSKVAAKNDMTLILFWASWCHKCEQEMPVIKRIYDKYHAQGFEIIGVSVDMDKAAWEKGIAAKECNWINVSQLEQWESPVAKDYRIQSTPVMFLVDSNRELLLKPDRAFKLEKWMQENYK